MLNMKKVDIVVCVKLVDLVSLGDKLEEMRACNEGMGMHCVDLLLEIQNTVISLAPTTQDGASASAPTTTVTDKGSVQHDPESASSSIQAVAEIRESVDTEYADLVGYRTRLGAALMDSGRLLSIIDSLQAENERLKVK